MISKKSFLIFSVSGSLFMTALLHADVTSGAPVIVDVGNSTDPYVSYLVIDDTSLGNSAVEYAWYYYDTNELGTTNPLTGDDLINAVVAGTSNTPYSLTPITEGAQGVDAGVDGFKIGNQTSTIVSIFDSSATAYWAYWIKGGSQTASYPPYTYVTPTNWVIAEDTPFDRLLTNGSYDGWTLSTLDANYNYDGPAPLSSASLIPEPSTLPIILLSLATLLVAIRWKPIRKSSTI